MNGSYSAHTVVVAACAAMSTMFETHKLEIICRWGHFSVIYISYDVDPNLHDIVQWIYILHADPAQGKQKYKFLVV